MQQRTVRQNGSVTMYGANGIPSFILDCPSSDGMKHRVYITGVLYGPNIIKCHAKAEIKKGGSIVKGIVKSSVKGWEFSIGG